MIEKIVIDNFQNHEHVEITFDQLVSIIVGPTDAGKSAIIRAFVWLCTNRPSGDSFIRDGAKSTKVKLFVDGHKIVRKKGKRTNCYYLDGQKFSAMGANVPEPIARILNIDDLNIQNQHDSSFWFSKTSGQVSRELNSIVNLGMIDESLANIQNKLRQAKSETEFTRQRLETAREQSNKLEWVKAANEQLQFVESLSHLYDKQTEDLRLLRVLASDVKRYTDSRDNAANAVLSLANCVAIGEKALQLQTDVTTIKKLLDDYKIASEIRHIQQPDLLRLNTLRNQVEGKDKDIEFLSSSLSELRRLDRCIKENAKSAKSGETQLHSQLKGSRCPLCGQKMSELS
jgi:DNA repair protein SbcC/Rad50